ARRDVRCALARERIVIGAGEDSRDGAGVTARGARGTAELIRRNTGGAAEGRTYAEGEAHGDAEGEPIRDRGLAARGGRTGTPIENADHALWVQSTTLQVALMQAYMAFRLAELTVGLGAALAATGAGLVAALRR